MRSLLADVLKGYRPVDLLGCYRAVFFCGYLAGKWLDCRMLERKKCAKRHFRVDLGTFVNVDLPVVFSAMSNVCAPSWVLSSALAYFMGSCMVIAMWGYCTVFGENLSLVHC